MGPFCHFLAHGTCILFKKISPNDCLLMIKLVIKNFSEETKNGKQKLSSSAEMCVGIN